MAENGDSASEERLRQAGRRLLLPHPPVQELLILLDHVSSWLSRIQLESPSDLQASIAPLPGALVTNELLWHPNMDVRVAVACCLCEILRITAPEPYYRDNQILRVVLELIVHCLKDLGDASSPSYNRRIKILELVANHRLGALMLEYEVLAVEMFDIFIETIRDDQPRNIFTFMETAMTEVIELFNEDEDISAELVAPLLATLRKDNEDVLPIAVNLARNVMENCIDILKPRLLDAVKYLDSTLDDYNDFVAYICEDPSGSESGDESPPPPDMAVN